MKKFSNHQAVTEGDGGLQLVVCITDDGLVKGQLWAMCSTPKESLGWKLNHFRRMSDSQIEAELLGEDFVGIEIAEGTMEEMLAYAKELEALAIIYRGENHWEAVCPDGKTLFCPERKG